MEAMAGDLHDAHSRISYHHHNIAYMLEVVDTVCGYAYSAQRTTIRAMITSTIAGGLALIMAVALIWNHDPKEETPAHTEHNLRMPLLILLNWCRNN
ncbi:unnamed protein product [Lactuca saligna]|uniref:Uncharacterized protein n=1 Tax=Lactuca saligna TaxID=75948 RepID=A0AA35YXL8_LACSI|nr:unnamed protein product [Lactuca saligna]